MKVPLSLSYHPYKNPEPNQPYMKTKILLVAALATSVLPTARLAIAEEAAATKTADRISRFGKDLRPGPAPTKPMRFAYVTKTLINEFWQDVAAGIKSEAGKYNIKFDAQAARTSLRSLSNLTWRRRFSRRNRTPCFRRSRIQTWFRRFRTPIFPPSSSMTHEPKAPTVTLEPTRSRSGPAEFLHQLYQTVESRSN